MLEVFSVTLPVFGLIGIGYGARRIDLVSERTGSGLSEFVFAIAVPALIFKTLTTAALPAEQPWGYWLAYFSGVLVVWMLGTLAASRLFGVTSVASVVAGFATGQSNTILVGVPLILKAYGPPGAVPLFLLLAIHLPVMLSVATVLAEGRTAHWTLVARQLATSPILIAILLAVFVQLSGLRAPAAVDTLVGLLAQSATPCALIAMGVALHRFGLRQNLCLAVLISILKLIVHPLIVYVLAVHILTIPPVWAGVAVLFAASPCGINAYLFAERYRAGVSIASSAIAWSTLLSAVTTACWLAILGIP